MCVTCQRRKKPLEKEAIPGSELDQMIINLNQNLSSESLSEDEDSN